MENKKIVKTDLNSIVMKNAEPYLIFNGECANAFAFYETVFDAEIAFISKYKDLPPGSDEVSEEDKERVIHALLPISNEVCLMGSDSPTSLKNTRGDNVCLMLNTESADEARKVFDRLSEGGEIKLPLEKTFFSDLYGMVTDKFGICWMVGYQLANNNK